MTKPELPGHDTAAAESYTQSEVIAFALREYSHEAAAEIGRLMQALDPTFSGEPIPEARLRRIVESPYHEQLIATRYGRIVGAATMTMVFEPGFDQHGYLGGVIVDPNIRRAGIGTRVMDAMVRWGQENGVDVIEWKTEREDTEGLDRQAAASFYDNYGARRVENAILYELDVPLDVAETL